MRISSCILTLLFFFPTISFARIFDMRKESFGTYLKGNYIANKPGQNSFINSSGQNMTLGSGQTHGYGYEFGMMFSKGVINSKLGLEVLQPPEAKSITGKNAAGTELYTFDSSLSDVIIKFGFEINLKTWTHSRFFLLAEGGYASLTLQNSYKFNAAGTAQFGLADFREELKSSTVMGAGSLGYEILLSDTTTFVLDLGYRYLNHTGLKHNVATTTFQGAVGKGDSAFENDGSTARSLNLSGFQAGVGLRFWLY